MEMSAAQPGEHDPIIRALQTGTLSGAEPPHSAQLQKQPGRATSTISAVNQFLLMKVPVTGF